MNTKILITLLLITFFTSFGQNFEGTITYKIQMINPYPNQISDSIWQIKQREYYGKDGFLLQRYFYKDNKYKSEIATDDLKLYEVFNPKDKLIYTWDSNSDSLITKKSNCFYDEFFEMSDTNETQKIMNIVCKSFILKSRFQKITIWYNSDYFKVDPKLYKGHLYNHLNQIFQKIECLPIKIEKYGEMGRLIQTIIDFKEEVISDEIFKIPNFENIVESKEN